MGEIRKEERILYLVIHCRDLSQQQSNSDYKRWQESIEYDRSQVLHMKVAYMVDSMHWF